MVKLNQKSVLLIVCSSAVLLSAFLHQVRGEEFIRDAESVMWSQMGPTFDGLIQNLDNSGLRFKRSGESTGGSQSQPVRKTSNNRNQEVKTSARSASNLGATNSEISIVKKEQQALTKDNLFQLKGAGSFMSILSKPNEMLKLIAKHFNLDQEKLKKQIGQSISLGAESIISPALVGIQIIEKVFVPDHCRLKLMCQAGAYVTARLQGNNSLMFKLQPKHIESSHFVRAFSEGHGGKDCEGAFPNCEPRLQKPYEDLMRSARETLGPLSERFNGNGHGHTNSNSYNSGHHKNHQSSNNQVAQNIQ